ncbi:Tryptophan synthase beta subunit-like PLP-dependent enzymes superfamily [Penicillium argentinense]|uniref:Tryptophan synthase beta subunit-like PLP-dependent enzymes superfamily n=1 Tax=Penicillium argentinense TaxID=1131581 RepID=A0A9W9KBG8_9EURO|nr:Tryptophan synthase beta subunit-like PLP-dependent enzymes superfamily [Penicillium argentinense]KAJ5099631.1 Tryptophan synthase beta subunit-like PLP-dependent enzymes superfamily [Penicillium argentinense]
MPVALPEIFSQIPRYPILYPHPSPIHYLPAISKLRGRNFYFKRDDQASPLACSGNKYRKLEYIVPDILSDDPKYFRHEKHPESIQRNDRRMSMLVTEGAVQSNHMVQVAALACKLNMKSYLLAGQGVGGGLTTSRNPVAFARLGNSHINRMFTHGIRGLDPGHPLVDDAEPMLEELRFRGERPYWIPGGASLHPLGGLGYARAAFEIVEQEAEMELGGSGRFDIIVVACGSGSTVAGLIAGFKLQEKLRNEKDEQDRKEKGAIKDERRRPPQRKVVGVLVSPTNPRSYHEERVLRFARQAGGLIGLDPEQDITMEDVHLDDKFVGPGYGIYDEDTKWTVEHFAAVEAILLDPVYTGKAARGMIEADYQWEYLGKSVCVQQDPNILFIHTGGQNTLSAYTNGTVSQSPFCQCASAPDLNSPDLYDKYM